MAIIHSASCNINDFIWRLQTLPATFLSLLRYSHGAMARKNTLQFQGYSSFSKTNTSPPTPQVTPWVTYLLNRRSVWHGQLRTHDDLFTKYFLCARSTLMRKLGAVS